MENMSNFDITETKNICRRNFCTFITLLPSAFFLNKTEAKSLEILNPIFLKVFTTNSKRVGEWMIENLTPSESVKILNNNMPFISTLSTLSDKEIKRLISEDFINEHVIDIGGCSFSIKEASICILSANYKGAI